MQIKNKRQVLTAILSILVSVFLVATVVYGLTTIGNDVSVGGNLTVGGNATSTGNQVVSGKLDVTATSTLATTTISNLTVTTASFTNLTVSSNATSSNLSVTGIFRSGSSAQFYIDADGNASTTGNLIVGGTTSLATTTIGGGTPISKHLSATTSVAFNLGTANTCTVATTSLSGAALGDVVGVGMPEPPTNDYLTSWGGWVSAADVVSLKYCTGAATTSDATNTARLDVWKH